MARLLHGSAPASGKREGTVRAPAPRALAGRSSCELRLRCRGMLRRRALSARAACRTVRSRLGDGRARGHGRGSPLPRWLA
eukprot:scaffold614_cov367-Prasinococcus_capsulatus_cf.AAC.26